MDEDRIDDLLVEAGDEREFGLVLAIRLALLEDFLLEVVLQRRRRLGLGVEGELAEPRKGGVSSLASLRYACTAPGGGKGMGRRRKDAHRR